MLSWRIQKNRNMKHLFTLLVLLCIAVSGKAQVWFDAGAHVAYGPTMMYDNSVFDNSAYKHKLTAGNTFGFRLGINQGYHVGLNLEYNLSHSKQDFNLHGNVFNKFDVKHNDFIGTIRYSGDGAFIEGGIEFANIKDVTLETQSTKEILPAAVENFEKNYLGGVLGFGSYLMGNDLFSVNLGIRLHWGFDEMVNPTGKDNNYPIFGNVGTEVPAIDPNNKTFQTAAQLQLEVNYAFGRFAKTACHDRWRLILFN
jgi:hypothetical protein